MKVGARIYGIDPEGLVSTAQRAESLGYESVWRGDHLAIPIGDHEPYPYSEDGIAPFSADTPILEPITLFSYLAARTERIKFATGICILPLREPYLLARMVTTLDLLSHGRMILGVGAGWMSGEFEVLGADFSTRGRVTTEVIGALRALWSQRTPEFHGKSIHIGGAMFEPKPSTRPHPPIVVGGESDAAVRRAARVGDGWYGHAFDVDHIRGRIAALTRYREEAGRSGPFEVTVRVYADATLDHVKRLSDVGVDRIVLESGSFSLEDPLAITETLETFAANIVTPLAKES